MPCRLRHWFTTMGMYRWCLRARHSAGVSGPARFARGPDADARGVHDFTKCGVLSGEARPIRLTACVADPAHDKAARARFVLQR